MISEFFKKLVHGYAFGQEELRKPVQVAPAPWRSEDGSVQVDKWGNVVTTDFVQVEDGGWVHHSRAVRLPRRGKFVWVRL